MDVNRGHVSGAIEEASMDQIERISAMEAALDVASSAVAGLEQALEA